MKIPDFWRRLTNAQQTSLTVLMVILLAIPISVTLTQKSGGFFANANLPVTAPVTSPRVGGDADGNGVVDGKDYVIWLNNYLTFTWEGASKGEFNNDGKVDGKDYVVWLNNYSFK